ncbi:MFS transporter [Streptomyces sp. AC495_CC817]|uniref:MFS transporter n=1 Tax=Streptomyces sp. AC495_CC817 TaxID=2823900 RepID=UPI001C271553|nr:MFS transporter [Streptomyces sp. AC495_CC817]
MTPQRSPASTAATAPGWRTLLGRPSHFRRFLVARTINLLGKTAAPIAISFTALDIGGSAADLGFVLTSYTVPLVVFLVLGGVVSDRFGQLRTVWVTSAAAAVVQLALAVAVISGRATVPLLVVAAVLTGTLAAAGLPALSGVVPRLVGPEERKDANVLLSGGRGLATILGPSAAGFLVAYPGAGYALLLDAACWALSAAMFARVWETDAPGRRAPGGSGVLDDLREGWGEFSSRRWLLIGVTGMGILNALRQGGFVTLAPAVVAASLGEQSWGLLLSAQAVGAILAVPLLSRLSFRRPAMQGAFGLAVYGTPLVAVALGAPLPLLLLCCLAAGIGGEASTVGWNLAMQDEIDPDVLSRVYSFEAVASIAVVPVGTLLAGLLSTRVDVAALILGAGTGYVVISVIMALLPSIRAIRRDDGVAHPEPGAPPSTTTSGRRTP